MNLTVNPWIPIIRQNATPATVTLRQVFEDDLDIRDLAVRPYERVALMRLLVAITQAALNGPADKKTWRTCRPHICSAVLKYLTRWHQAFELLDGPTPFLQIPTLQADKPTLTSKLDLALATGVTPTLFDNAGGSDRAFTPAKLALHLLTFQAFSPGSRIGIARWNNHMTPGNGASIHAPCLAGRMLHAMPLGPTLIDTIHRNLLTKRQVQQLLKAPWGQPIWERMPKSFTDTPAIRNATTTYLGRLVPMARAISLSPNGRSLLLANGLEYPSYPNWREPTATIVLHTIKNKSTLAALKASTEKALWRHIPAITTLSTTTTPTGGPIVLHHTVDLTTPSALWIGGLITNQAKPLGTIEAVFPLSPKMLSNSGRLAYEQGLCSAKTAYDQVVKAIVTFHCARGNPINRPNAHKRIETTVDTRFWSALESSVHVLIAFASAPEPLGPIAARYWLTWEDAIQDAQRSTYNNMCPRLTARDKEAYAVGLRMFYAAPTTTLSEY